MTAPDTAASLPLSENELASWLAHRLDPASFAGNITHALRLVGPIDEGAVHRSIQRLVDRHPVLRARYVDVDGVPRRVELAQEVVAYEAVTSSTATLDDQLTEFAHHHFDLVSGPVFRVRLHRLAADDHVLACSCHHIVADMWSLVLLIDDFLTGYRIESGLGGDEPAPPPSTYAAFAAKQAADLTTEKGRMHETFWTDRLAGGAGSLQLPADRPRPSTVAGVAAPLMARVPAPLRAGLEGLTERTGAALPDVLLAAFQTLLHRYTGRDDVIVGMPKANRSVRTARVVGCFMNPVAVRTDVSGDPPFVELVARSAAATRELAAHDRYPVLTMAQRQSAGGRPFGPLFDVVFSWQKSSRAIDQSFSSAVALGLAGVRSELDGLTWETVAMPVRPAPVDVSLLMAEVGDELGLTIEYRVDVFDRWRMEAMVGHYLRLLEAVVEDPTQPISTLPLLTDTERAWHAARLPERLGPGEPPPVHAAVAQRAREHPERIAITTAGHATTYGELNTLADRFAHQLVGRGVRPGDVVGVQLPRSVEMVAALLAVLQTGAAYVPLDPAFPADRLRFMVADAGARLVIIAGDGTGDASHHQAELVEISSLDVDPPADPVPAPTVGPHDLAYVIYTSGSTGSPKGVEIEHGSLRRFLDAFGERPGIEDDDVVLSITTLSFDPSVVELLLPLLRGARIVLAPQDASRDPELLGGLIDTTLPTVVQATPTTWRMLVDAGWRGHPGLRILTGGEALTQRLAADLLERGAEVWNVYGPTETTVWCTAKRITSVAERITIGTPIGAMSVRVLDAHQKPLPVGIPGELHVGGPGVARGYRNRPEHDAQQFVADRDDEGRRIYRTGDLAQLRPDGEIEHLGRIDRQVKMRGHRIELGEIEAALTAHPGIAAAVVVGRSYGPGDDRLVAYTTSAETSPTAQALRAHLALTLPSYMLPAAFVMVDSFPLTPTGKIDNARLPAPGQLGRETVGDTPHPGIEATIATVWEHVLAVPVIGRDDDFFDLGGHSLLATMIVSRLRSALGVDLPVRAVFSAPTVALLAGVVVDSQGRDGRAPELPPVERVDRDADHRLSAAQERMWFLQQLEPRGTAYNLGAAVRVRGALDIDALRWAFDQLIDRHESLRTWFDPARGTPVQRIAAHHQLEVQLTDHDAATAAERFDAAHRAILDEAHEPYDLSALPLIRCSAHRIGSDDHLLFVGMHHIISDQWSFGVLGLELSELYRARRAGDTPQLPELASQHIDYAAWHRGWLDGGVTARQLAYWRRRLDGSPVVDLPADHTRPPMFTSAGDAVVTALPPGLAARVARFGGSEQASSFMVYLACFQALVHRYTAASDISIGSPVANRNWLESEHLLSSFVNTLVMRVDLDGDPSFSELLRRVRAVALEAFGHQDLPFDRLVSELQPARDPSRSPLFQLFFNLQNAPAGLPQLADLEMELVPLERRSAQFDVSISIDSEWSNTLSLEYRVDVFERWRMEAMVGHFLRLLEAAIDDPERPISRLSLLTDRERAELAAADDATIVEVDERELVHHAVARRARERPERLAVTFGRRTTTYAELEALANRLARHLVGCGVQPGDIVGIHLHRSVEMVAAILAVLKAGAAYLPLDPAFPDDRIEFMVRDSRCRVVLTTSDLPRRAGVDHIELDRIDTRELSTAAPDIAVRPDDLAYVIYTSGSTGRPKGVQIEHRNVTNFLASMATRPGMCSDDTLLSITTLSFDISVLEILGTLVTGGHLVLLDRASSLDPTALGAALDRHQPTIMQATPTTWRLLVGSGWGGRADLKILCGGEPLAPDLARELHGRCAELWNMYGPTETTVWSTIKRITDPAEPITIGTPIDNTTLRVLDHNLQAVPTGVPGELHIGGDGVARGYLDRAELTAQRFIADPDHPGRRIYATGDLARRLPSGEIEHLGRIDHQVKVRGHRIELGEIESALATHPQVTQAVVTAHAYGPGDVRLVAYVTADRAPSGADLRQHLGAILPAYMVPATFLHLDAFPLTPNKKIDRNALPTPTTAPSGAPSGAAPHPGIEATIAAVWQSVLNVPAVSRDDDFFDLGGHSLLAVRVFAELAEATGQRFPLTSLFRAPTVAGLAEILSGEGWTSAFTSLIPVQTHGRRRPLFVVSPFLITSLSFANLARLLGDEQPLYALQPQGLESDDPPHPTIEEMAAHYVSEVRRVQPDGPYAIAGHCAGSWVAFEVAAQLQSLGEEVGPLVLVDSEPPGVAAPRRRWIRHLAQRTWHYARHRRLRAALLWKVGVARERLRASRSAGGDRDRVAMVRGVHAAAHRRYGGTIVKGDALLLRSEESVMLADKDWHLAWADVITGQLQVKIVPGAHSALLERPGADVLAAHLRTALDEAGTSG